MKHLIVAAGLIFALIAACAGPQRPNVPAGYPVGFSERGVASWYGPGFHGNKTANGERFDMHRMTAAHRTLPIGSILVVRSLSNGREIKVRVNDRGPFARGRILDVSQAAAQSLGMISSGTDEVELRVVAYEARAGAIGMLRVQAGSFTEIENARTLAGRIGRRYGEIRVLSADFDGKRRYRVRIGQFAAETQAEAVAEEIERRFNVDTLVIRDDV